MIKRVRFDNFKSLREVAIDLGQLTVLVGPNGCGKSSVLEGIHLLSQTGLRRPLENEQPGLRFSMMFGGSRDPQRLASPGRPTTLQLAIQEDSADELKIAIFVPERNENAPEDEPFEITVSVAGPAGKTSATIPPKNGPEELLLLDHPRVRRFMSVVYLHLDASKMSRTSVPQDEEPRMRFDGSGLASALAWMKGAAEDELAKISLDLRKIVPGVKRIRTLRERVSQRRMERIDIDRQPIWRPVDETLLGDRFEIEFDHGESVPADLLSEGTVLALGLMAKLREPRRARLVLLDDIDRGLHIQAQSKLVEVLRELMVADPELQIVCTTHSPYLLDRFQPSEVRVLDLDEHRCTHVRTLVEHPEFEKWKFGAQTGELWAALGEAWVTRERGGGESA